MSKLLPAVGILVAGFLTNARAEDELTKEAREKIRTVYGEARSLFASEKYRQSNEKLAELLGLLPAASGKLDPNRARIHYETGTNYALLGQKKESFQSLRLAIQAGFWDAAFMKEDATLANLRGDSDFDAVVNEASRGLAGMSFGLKDIAGNELRKEDFAGKVTIIDVWGTWCPPCRAEIPSFNKLHKKYRKKGLRIIGMTWEKRAPNEAVKRHVTDFASRFKINYPVVLMPQAVHESIPRSLLRGFPTTFFVGRDGLVAGQVTGLHTYDQLERMALRLLSKPAPTD